jgi:hypothetical protein
VPPNLFNSREDVLMIFGAIFVAFAVKVAPGPALGAVRAALSPSLVRVFALALLPPAAFVFLAYRMGWWHTSALKEMIDWLDRHGILYRDLCLLPDKAAVGANLYIDDTPDNVEALRAKGLKTIVFSNSTNTEVDPP